ncbi:hypothetical protein DL771_000634 [Monosporascus sp. 5C6A]|nr:hypothetical protein DL771_000634 [Monosporascus sp. 5C6A]
MDRYPDNDGFALNDDAILARLLDPQQLSGPSTMRVGWSPDVATSNCPINLVEFHGQQTVDMEAGGVLGGFPSTAGFPSTTGFPFNAGFSSSIGFPSSTAEVPFDPFGIEANEAQHRPISQFANSQRPGPDIEVNTPFEHARTGGIQYLSQVPRLAGPRSEAFLEVPEEPPPVQAAHGRVGHLTPFACVKCFTTFRDNSELLKHGKDTDHHPYACHCGKDFSRLDSLKRHLKSRAAGSETCKWKAKHSCPFCTKYDGEKGFDRRDHLLQHLRGRHHFEENGIAFMKVRAGRKAPAPAQAVSNAAGAVAQNAPVPRID